ncbi:uncharacterized protein LOC126264834 [Aethina tumida]|uniref:uncharacterized protein LOC126264834 n=1 Tax=Aethina tumida TaxID=116153 RepID=UPI002147B79F|nr:uncharacterized protein LOC126264834 [Aethina tumida]
MFTKLIFVLLVGAVVSATPRQGFRYRTRSQRLEQAPVPHTVYGPPTVPPQPEQPPQEYGPPQPPQEVTTVAQETTTDVPTTTEAVTEEVATTTEADDGTKAELNNGQEQGVYYIYHPSGALQKVVYSTQDDLKNMEYRARLKYETVQPIREPIYTYDPNTFVFSRIAF